MPTDVGALTLPLVVTAMPDGVVWLPAHSERSDPRATLGAGHGDVVRISREVRRDLVRCGPPRRQATWRSSGDAAVAHPDQGLVVFVVLSCSRCSPLLRAPRRRAACSSASDPNRAGPSDCCSPWPTVSSSRSRRASSRAHADMLVYLLAPMIAATCAFLAFAVIPVGPV